MDTRPREATASGPALQGTLFAVPSGGSGRRSGAAATDGTVDDEGARNDGAPPVTLFDPTPSPDTSPRPGVAPSRAARRRAPGPMLPPPAHHGAVRSPLRTAPSPPARSSTSSSGVALRRRETSCRQAWAHRTLRSPVFVEPLRVLPDTSRSRTTVRAGELEDVMDRSRTDTGGSGAGIKGVLSNPLVIAALIGAVATVIVAFVNRSPGSEEVTTTTSSQEVATTTNSQEGKTTSNGRHESPGQEALLLERNVRLSGGTDARNSDVRSWLQSDPGYKNLAVQLVNLLSDRRLNMPVHLDTINGKYIAQISKPNRPLDTGSLAPGEYGNRPALERAILEHWQELYGQDATALIAISQPL